MSLEDYCSVQENVNCSLGTTGGANEKLTPAIDPVLLSACIHCGLCLPACPTYLATGREMESPRGRLHLIGLWQTGSELIGRRLADHLESCLGCFGCQTACPSGVEYEQILNQARPSLANMRPKRMRRLMRFAFSRILPDYVYLRRLGTLVRLWQKLGGGKVGGNVPAFGIVVGKLLKWQSFLPEIPKFVRLPRQSWMSGPKKGVVQLFSGCVMDILYNPVNHACLRLLTKQRYVACVPEQTCCGALSFHAGETDLARGLAKRNIELFESTQGAIVVTASGCAAMLAGYGQLLKHDQAWSERAESFSRRVKDITEFLSLNEFATKPRCQELKVAYHKACHLVHEQKIEGVVEKLLGGIDGINLVPLEEDDHCCGSAGIFNLTHTELSSTILKRKIAFLKDTGVSVVVTTNPGCMLQLAFGLREAGLDMAICHLAQILDEAYGDG